MAHLNVTSPDGKRKVEIDPAQPLVIGRDATAGVQLDDRKASRLHARIVVENDDFVLQDLESTNGTFVNEKRASRHVLLNGDVVRIGAVRLEFQGGPKDRTASKPASSAKPTGPKIDLGIPKPKRVNVKLESGRSRRRTQR